MNVFSSGREETNEFEVLLTEKIQELLANEEEQQILCPSSDDTDSLYGMEISMLAVENEMDKFRRQPSHIQKRPFYLTSHSTEISHHTFTLKHKRPSIPRILKSDIRKNYPVMFLNVMNSFDYQSMYSFFDFFGQPDLSMKKKFYLADGEGILFSPIKRKGIRAVADYFHANSLLAPDTVFRIGRAQIKATSEPGAIEILSQVVISGTRLYDCNSSDILEFIESVYEKQGIGFEDPLFERFWYNDVKRLENPIPFHINGLVSMYITSDQKISRIRFRSYFSYGYLPSHHH